MLWLAASLLLLAVAFVLGLDALAYAMYALLGLMLLSRLLSKKWIESISAKRHASREEAEIGQKLAMNVDIRNSGGLPIAWVLAEELLPRKAMFFNPPSLKLDGQRLLLSIFWPKQTRTLRYELTCNRRGYYQLGPLVLETGDLFGLHRRFKVETEPHYLTVYPKVIPLEGYDIASRRPIGEVRMTHRLFEDPTRVTGVRAYQAGDAMNRIHWRATARTGTLQSKTYEPSTIAGATIILDLHESAYPAKDEPIRSDLAVTTAASVANALYLMGQQVGFITNGRDMADRARFGHPHGPASTRQIARSTGAMADKSSRLRPIIVPTRRGPEQFFQIREVLARAELTDGFRLPELIDEVYSQLPRDASIIVITPLVTPEVAIALGELSRAGYAVTAILNLWEDHDFAQQAGPLAAQRIEVRHLKEESRISTICRRLALR
jgi:uncharacterized protein (DUF58 family)